MLGDRVEIGSQDHFSQAPLLPGEGDKGNRESWGTEFSGTHHQPFEGSFGEKKKNNHRLFLPGLF